MEFLRTRGWVALTRSAQLIAHTRIQQLSNGGALDAQVSNQLVETLLKGTKCICGSDLHEGTEARSALEQVKLALGNFEAPQRYSGLKDAMQSGVLDVNAALAEWGELQEETGLIRDQIAQLSEEEQRLRLQITSDINDTYLDAQLSRLEEVKFELESIEQALTLTKDKLTETEAALSQKRADLSEAQSAQGQHGILIRQMQSLERVLDSIAEDAANVRSNMRLELEAELNKQIRPVYMNEPVTVSIDSNFGMTVTKNGVPFGEANGQKVLRALALVIVLYRISTRLALVLNPEDEERTEATFPLVIDAGFGVLGSGFVNLAADWLVDLKTQVVLILLDNAAQGVLQRIRPAEEDISILEMRQKSQGEDAVTVIASKEATLIRFGQKDKETVIQRLSE
jgi:DNA sulfur modification protein DndD